MAQEYSADLLALYAAAPYTKIYRAHLFAIGPCRNGAMIYATDGRAPITVPGTLFNIVSTEGIQTGHTPFFINSVVVIFDSDASALTGRQFQFAGLTTETWLNGLTLTAQGEYGGNPNAMQFNCDLVSGFPGPYGTVADTGTAQISTTYHPWLYGFWKRGAQTVKIGFESNPIDLTVYSDEQFQPIFFPGTNNLVYLMDGIYAGLLAAAPVTIYRATMSTWGVVVGPTGGSLISTRFVGECGETNDLGPTKCTIKVRDLMYRLNLDCPQQLIQANCRWVLYSSGCALSKAAFTRSGQSIGGLIDPRTLQPAANLSTISPAGTFSKGQITFTSGANNGITYTVAVWTPGAGSVPDQVQLDAPPLFDMTVGDTFSIAEGCNHTFASCLNLQPSTAYVNFGGMNFVPQPEAAL